MNEKSSPPTCLDETSPPMQGADAPRSGSAFITAVQFLTRLPIGGAAPSTAAALKGCAVFFPFVGALIGVFTAGVLGVGCLLWPIWLAIIVALAAEIRLTGALHEDAVADFADAFGGGWTREDVLTILKDSRIGTYGTVALLLALALRGGAMIAIVQQNGVDRWFVWGSAIVASAAIGRWAIVLAMVLMQPVAGRESLMRDIGVPMRCRDLFFSSLWCLPAAAPFAVFMPKHFLFAILLLIPAVFILCRGIQRRLGGVTGDCLGCVGYISQVLVLLAAAAKFEA